MNKSELFIGFTIGILMSLLGCFLFITLFSEYDFISGYQIMKAQGQLGKLITIGSVLDLVVFGIMLRTNKELMARGVVLAVIVIALVTIFI